MDQYKIDGQKIHYHPERLSQWYEAKTIKDKLNIYPIYVEISPVGQCNHRCNFCAVDYIGYVNRSLPTSKLESRIIEMGKCGIKSIMFAGEGEPMLHNDIEHLVETTAASGIDVGFTTNGTMMDDKFLTCLADCTFIKISLNGGDRETYAKIHRVKESHFDLVWNNIISAITHRNTYHLKTAIGVQCLILPDNMNSIHSLAKKCWEVGVDYLVLKPYSHKEGSITTTYKDLHYGNRYNEVILNAMQFVSSKFEIIARKQTMENYDNPNRGYNKCLATPYFWAYIMATGDVYGCSSHLMDPRFNYGNINSSSFSEIWTGESRRKSIEFVEHDLDISTCRKTCRMDKVNRYLDDIRNQGEHRNFI